MGTHKLEDVMKFWEVEKFTPEQTIGHILQHIQLLVERVEEVEARVLKLERRLREEGAGGAWRERGE
jgi:hypothetical protein